jgi:rRNA biogenesis protein RRP5
LKLILSLFFFRHSVTENTADCPYKHGEFVPCRVLGKTALKNVVDVSLRPSRIEGDLDEDDPPEVGDLVHAYVVDTNKKGCFLRLSRKIEGRVTLKELCDGFLPDPFSSFPCGRLVVGKVIAMRAYEKRRGSATLALNVSKQVDLDLRESVISSMEKLKFEDIDVGGKYKGRVTRIEEYGVFVAVQNSDVSGLVHKSECSDNYIKKLSALYAPGDQVKVLVVKKDDEKRQIGFSMKASHFKGDPDSDDETSDSFDEDLLDRERLEDSAKSSARSDDVDSEDENFVTKLASRVRDSKNSSDGTDASDSVSSSDDVSSSGDSSARSQDSADSGEEEGDTAEEESSQRRSRMDTDVGFEWGGAPLLKAEPMVGSDSDSGGSGDYGEEEGNENDRRSHKSRRKHAKRLRDEQEIMRRETALADGTADENPETSTDFERLLAGNPNSSELWIKVCLRRAQLCLIDQQHADFVSFRLSVHGISPGDSQHRPG